MKLSMILGITGAGLLGGTLEAQPCSVATMKGEWGIVVNILSRQSAPNGPLEQAVGTLIRRYDGAGGFTQVDNVHGAISGYTPDRPGKGTYTVNPDCTGSAKLEIPGVAFQPEERFVIVEDGNAIVSATTNPPSLMATNQGRRLVTVDAARTSQAEALARLLSIVNTIAFRLGIAVPPAN